MLRRGSLVSFIAAAVVAHPIYSLAIGNEFKVEKIIDRKGRKFAKLENGVKVPVIILQGIPQKKGKLALARVPADGTSVARR
jgi:hypothetical protein